LAPMEQGSVAEDAATATTATAPQGPENLGDNQTTSSGRDEKNVANRGSSERSEVAHDTKSETPATQQPARRRRKKKSRWGEGGPSLAAGSSTRKKTRWGPESDKEEVSANAAYATKDMNPSQTETFLLRVKLENINQKLRNPAEHIDSVDLGPSPDPIYDSVGQRVNTKEKRFREYLVARRQELLEKAIAKNPALKALAPGFQAGKKIKRVTIPVDKYPDYNFIGLIIGPRGNTQKRMEKETGCKISIRGKGSNKKGRPQADDDQPLHVHIIAPDEEKLVKAEKMISKLLVPVSEDKNMHKAKQLRELAIINGTLKDIPTCRICGEDGHRIQDCPKRQAGWQAAVVKCGICGSDTHLTQDCNNTGPETTSKLNDEYASFMAELGGGSGEGSGSAGSSMVAAASHTASSAGSGAGAGSGSAEAHTSSVSNDRGRLPKPAVAGPGPGPGPGPGAARPGATNINTTTTNHPASNGFPPPPRMGGGKMPFMPPPPPGMFPGGFPPFPPYGFPPGAPPPFFPPPGYPFPPPNMMPGFPMAPPGGFPGGGYPPANYPQPHGAAQPNAQSQHSQQNKPKQY